MLNTSKGPAVHSLRAQADRKRYQMEMKHTIERQENLYLKQAEIVEIKVDEEGLWWKLEGETEWKLLMNITDLAGHSKKYTVTLKSDGEVIDTITDVTYKSTIQTITPYKQGYTFMGWEYSDKTEYNDSDLITDNIELNAMVALEHLADAILFIFDASETCGYSLENQFNLLEEIRNIFDAPMIFLFNKMDIANYEGEQKEYIQQYIDRTEEPLLISAAEGEGIEEIIQLITSVEKREKIKEETEDEYEDGNYFDLT